MRPRGQKGSDDNDSVACLLAFVANLHLASERDRPSRVTAGFTTHERKLIDKLRTPGAVQRFLNQLPYNDEPGGRATLRGFRGVVRHRRAHCLEAALFAAVVLEAHGYPPLVLSFESVDALDHVLFVYRRRGRWGSIARSRDPGLHGRRPLFATPRALALSYVDPYIDFTGRITGYAVVDLGVMGSYDWRLGDTNLWKVERMLLDYPHRRIASSDARVERLRERYRAFRDAYPGRKPVLYRGRERWTEIPAEFSPSRNLAWVSIPARPAPA
jgi:hypothetical protein